MSKFNWYKTRAISPRWYIPVGPYGAYGEYMKRNGRKINRPRAKCHPDRPHYGRGLCEACYQKRKDPIYHREKKYKLPVGAYKQLLTLQNNTCAICGNLNSKERDLFIDHDHTTGQVRGLLCCGCNQAVGLFETRKYLIPKILEYLERSPAKCPVPDSLNS